MELEKTKAIIEAILFSVGRAVKIKEIMYSLEISEEEIKNILENMKLEYEKENRGIEIINKLYDEEAENIYYKLTNIHIPEKIEDERIKEIMTYKTMNELTKYYSYRQILELIEKTKELKDLTDKEIKEKIKNYSLKMQEMLTIFWLTNSNDNFFSYFGFNWVPSIELQNKARKIMKNSIRLDYNPIEVLSEIKNYAAN